MGVFAYVSEVMATPAQMAESYNADQLAMLAARPGWVTGAFALAVFAGLVGSLGLLLRKTWARPLFLLSLLAVLVQQFWIFFRTEFLAIAGMAGAALPLAVVVIGIFAIWFAGQGTKRGWLR